MKRYASIALAIALAGNAFPQQSVPKAQAKQVTKSSDGASASANSSAKDRQSSTNKSAAGTFRGRFYTQIGPSHLLSDIQMMFQDVTTCRSYEFAMAGSGSFSTEGFFVVTGALVGKTLRANASTRADDATSERLKTLQNKCEEPK